MRKILLSTVAISMLAVTGAYADSASDIAEMKAMMKQMNQRLAKLEKENIALKSEVKKTKIAKKTSTKKKTVSKKNVHYTKSEQSEKIATLEEKVEKIEKHTTVKSKAPLLKFSGKHYLGFVSSEKDGSERENKFETRRNYFQVKGYLGEDSKDYFRITLDTFHNDDELDGDDKGSWEVRLKYAYLYLDNILPFTGVEIGQAHRPWIDYEEHGGWNYRSISKVFVEDSNGAHLTNSADLGVNFKTKMDYFSSELGLFNGEGYHGIEEGEGLSAEWRLTGHILGTGTQKRKKSSTYADVSFLGQWNDTSNKHGDEDLNWYGVHGVYNQPEFLLAGQYVETVDAADGLDGSVKNYAGSGYSLNGEVRLGELANELNNMGIIGRYDSFELDNSAYGEQTTLIAGITYKYNKYVEIIANYMGQENYKDGGVDKDSFMLTTEVNW